MTLRTGNSIPYRALTLDEWQCPTCKHRWFEFSDEDDIECCPRCGSDLGEWFVLWDTDSCADGFRSNSFEHAKRDALDLLLEWETQEQMEWDGFTPTPEQIDSWDYMIESCSVMVCRHFPDDSDNYEEVWAPDDDELKRVGWVYYEELKPALETLKERSHCDH